MSATGLKSDVPGVVWDASRDRWRAYGPGKDGKRIFLGSRRKKEEAEALRLNADGGSLPITLDRAVRIRMRAVWREMTKRDAPHGWASFDHFVATVGDRPSEERKIVAADESRPIGPDNFKWTKAEHDFLTQDGRKAYLRKRYRQSPATYRKHELMRKFKITPEQYDDMLKEQNGVCAICAQPETAIRQGRVLALCVDHNHRTGATRGLLCTACNIGIGSLAESQERLRSAIAYLDHWNAVENAPLPENVVAFKKADSD